MGTGLVNFISQYPNLIFSRDLILGENDVAIDVVVEAIIKSDKTELLKRFISEYDENGKRETIGFFLLKAANIGTPKSVQIIIDEIDELGSFTKLSKFTNKLGNTALHEAAISGSKFCEEIMDLLISKESQLLEIENEDLRTPLHLAAHGVFQLNTKILIGT